MKKINWVKIWSYLKAILPYIKILFVKNLYITGELLDVNGDCGGYNLTFAFLSGILTSMEDYNA